MAVWIVKGGRQGEFEERFLSQGVVGKGGVLPDLSTVQSVTELRQKFEETARPSAVRTKLRRAGSRIGVTTGIKRPTGCSAPSVAGPKESPKRASLEGIRNHETEGPI